MNIREIEPSRKLKDFKKIKKIEKPRRYKFTSSVWLAFKITSCLV